MFGDVCGCVHVVLWGKDIGAMVEGGSYKLIGASVQSYDDCKYLSVGGECKIVCVDDVGDVVEGCLDDQNLGSGNHVGVGEVDGVYFCGVF